MKIEIVEYMLNHDLIATDEVLAVEIYLEAYYDEDRLEIDGIPRKGIVKELIWRRSNRPSEASVHQYLNGLRDGLHIGHNYSVDFCEEYKEEWVRKSWKEQRESKHYG